MGKYWRVLGEYDAETQAWSAFAGAGGASPYNHDKAGRMVGIKIIVGSQAATSLIEGAQIRLTCTDWSPNMMSFAVSGTGLRTAPGTPPPQFDYVVDQPVTQSSRITLEGINLVATAVTVSIQVIGCFEG